MRKVSEVIEKYSELRADEIISILQEMFPVAARKENKRASATSLIHVVRVSLKKLISRKRALQDSALKAIEECKSLLNALLDGQTINLKN